MTDITMGSLFDGSAGFPLAGIMYGMKAVWASEIEPYPIRVTTKRLPFMKHYGNITEMDGSKVEPVDVITGGSPCQDMSVAGKRAGLDGERSCLFREQIRIIKEMREVTNGKYPRYMVWENVPGSLSSNKGADFRCVLEETARIKDAGFNVPMPDKNKWSGAGLIVGEGFSVGWRILDAQYWGVPQRRRRIFLVADFGGTSSGEILFKREGLSWHFAQSRESWQTVAGNLATGIDEAGEPFCYNGENLTSPINKQNPIPGDPCHTLGTDSRNYVMIQNKNPIFSIDREAMNSGYEFDRAPGIDESETAYTLKATGPGGVAHPAILEMTHADEVIRQHEDGVCPTLQARMGTGGNQVPLTMQVRCEGGGKGKGKAYSLQGNMIGRTDKNGPQGSGINEEVNFTLNATDQHAVGTYQKVLGPLMANSHPGSYCSQDAFNDMFVANNYIVRRLTPLECARLQGFPDWWTANLGTKEEDITEEDMNFWRDVFETHRELVTKSSKPKTDKQIKKWLTDPDSDSAEYKMWGNGVALPCVLHVMEGIANVLNKEKYNGQPIVCEFQNTTCSYPIDDCENCPVRPENREVMPYDSSDE